MRGNGNGAQSAAGTACQATAKQLQKQAKMWREKVKLTDKRFQNCGKTLFFSKNHADFGYCFEPKKHNFRWQAQGIVTFNVENTVLLTPPARKFMGTIFNHTCLGWWFREKLFI